MGKTEISLFLFDVLILVISAKLQSVPPNWQDNNSSFPSSKATSKWRQYRMVKILKCQGLLLPCVIRVYKQVEFKHNRGTAPDAPSLDRLFPFVAFLGAEFLL